MSLPQQFVEKCMDDRTRVVEPRGAEGGGGGMVHEPTPEKASATILPAAATDNESIDATSSPVSKGSFETSSPASTLLEELKEALNLVNIIFALTSTNPGVTVTNRTYV